MANNCLGPIFLDLLFSFSNTHSMFFDTFNGLVSYFFSSLKIFLIIPIWRYCGFLWVFVSEFNSLIHVDMFVEAWLGGRGQFVSMCLVSRKIPKNLLHFLCCIVFPPAANEWESLFCMSFGYSVLCLGGNFDTWICKKQHVPASICNSLWPRYWLSFHWRFCHFW